MPSMCLSLLLAALILTLAPAPAQDQKRPSGSPAERLTIGETFTIPSKVLGETRRVNVYAPAAYTASPAVRLPVLYMPDGGIHEDFLHVAGLLQVLTGNGTMRPFLLVGIENTERRRDMTGPTANAEDKKIAPRVGGSAAFRAFLRDELMPEVRTRYSTTDETAIVGESLAGLFVVETFVVAPEMFDTFIAFDPSLWWNDKKLVSGAADLLRAKPRAGRSLFLASSGDAGLKEPVTVFASAAEKSGARVQHEHMPAETHATIYHPAALRAFRALFKPGAPSRREVLIVPG
ncbi:MAG: alpha/beta hydrolase-fold protein [Acidobacteriota bacterium]|nr:alpha/beta hydrolase-fold protein [Acidobacteriota bacterium]